MSRRGAVGCFSRCERRAPPSVAAMTQMLRDLIIGGGQAGLAAGYHLARRDRSFVILDARERIGDSWRERWDSLRLFTPARYDGLPGLPFPLAAVDVPHEGRDGRLPRGLRRALRAAGEHRRARRRLRRTATATSCARASTASRPTTSSSPPAFQTPIVPEFAAELDPAHPAAALERVPQPVAAPGRPRARRRRGQLRRRHRARPRGRPSDDGSPASTRRDPLQHRRPRRAAGPPRHLVRLDPRAHVRTPIGRKARPKSSPGGPLIRVKREAPRRGGRRAHRAPRRRARRPPLLDDGRVLDVANVVWCTGFRKDARGSTSPHRRGRASRDQRRRRRSSPACTSSAAVPARLQLHRRRGRPRRRALADHIARRGGALPPPVSGPGPRPRRLSRRRPALSAPRAARPGPGPLELAVGERALGVFDQEALAADDVPALPAQAAGDPSGPRSR